MGRLGERLPLDFVGRLSNEESLSVSSDLGTAWIYRDLAVGATFPLDLDRQQQQLQFREAQPRANPQRNITSDLAAQFIVRCHVLPGRSESVALCLRASVSCAVLSGCVVRVIYRSVRNTFARKTVKHQLPN